MRKTEDETNSYTGLFKDKNVIFLQLEGMDTWLLSKENTPNLYNLLNHSIKFTDIIPYIPVVVLPWIQNLQLMRDLPPQYLILKMYILLTLIPLTIPWQGCLKRPVTVLMSFHMNSADFYSRGINYKSWGIR